MTYEKFATSYPWLKKNYPEASRILGNEGTVTKETYHKVGSRWKLVETETEHFDDRFYCNTFDAVPFFRRLGGYERVTCCYTTLGYIPVEVVSISPDKQTRIVRKFEFKGKEVM